MAPGEEQDFDPTKDATVKLLRHITEKGFQLGSCIGSFIVVPVIAYRGRASNCPTVPKMLRGLSRSAVYTTIAAGLLGLGMVYGTPLTPEGPPLDYCFMDIGSLKNLSELKPVNGFVKGCAAPPQLNKPSTANAPVTKPTANAEASAKPMQQLQTAAAVTPLQFELNSRAIKLANNPLKSLAGLQEAAAAVLDEPAELRWLDLSQCKLTNIQDELTRFPKLQMLYLHANQITKLSDVKKLGKLSGLQKLTLHGNPIAELPHYKLQVLSCMPTLRELDFVAVSKLDRDTVSVWTKAQRGGRKA
ncbi:hypothetical protein WJX79_003250 [Trebouxia sp. C0005]